MDQKRRLVIKGIAGGAAASLVGCGGGHEGERTSSNRRSGTGSHDAPSVSFRHGVASGDPLVDRVILWTRITPVGFSTAAVPVSATVASDPEMRAVIARFEATAHRNSDYCVKIDAGPLPTDQWFYYRFYAGGQGSPIGRTRTLPPPGASVDRARFAMVSCAAYTKGYFSVYRALACQDIDFVLHLGDYIYEYGAGGYPAYPLGSFPGLPSRPVQPTHETVTLHDYRTRYAHYREDPDLRALHQQFPFIAVWDDHETANNSYEHGAGNHQPATEGSWAVRKANAQQAYFEWLPIREYAPGNHACIYRRFQFGDLIDLSMLDTRLEGRDKPVDSPLDPARNDPGRHIISESQMQWLLDGLSRSTARWRVIGQQVMFAQLNVAELPTLTHQQALLRGSLAAVNVDQWDGYVADRVQILDHLAASNINNVVVLSGDIHSSWANEIYRNPATLLGDISDPSLAVEFVTPSVTSPGLPPGAAEIAHTLLPVVNPHVRYLEAQSHGFVLIDVDHQRIQAEYSYVTGIKSSERRGQLDPDKTKLLAVRTGESHLRDDGLSISRPRLNVPAPAPAPGDQDAV